MHYWPALVQEIIYEQETKRIRENKQLLRANKQRIQETKKLNLKAPKKAARETENNKNAVTLVEVSDKQRGQL